jgi:hypothetical protein
LLVNLHVLPTYFIETSSKTLNKTLADVKQNPIGVFNALTTKMEEKPRNLLSTSHPQGINILNSDIRKLLPGEF